jgi:hypothetical protein
MERDRTMETDVIFRDRIELPMTLVIDVTGEPEELKESVKATLRRLFSEDEHVRNLAREDMLMAFIMETPAACTMSCGGDSAEAIKQLAELQCLSAEVDDDLSMGAAEARMNGRKLE